MAGAGSAFRIWAIRFAALAETVTGEAVSVIMAYM
jgi:hypothetical protein